ncbi:uncharacterized protein LOC117382811 [Periophthalmus magnuspinnatus]|uniref:uncharacterized protein LOC117382811 n=1 Tax=Periophthalmus magnuspinnatus TaxID=409849 RepID=UPI0024367B48|nr:uncharacterized protein LOC117382811 [Periophthalmus magnuspinnatus]
MKPTWPPLAELSSALQKERFSHKVMDTVDVCTATSTADNGKRRGHNKNRDWLKRLHLRKAALQPPAMQTPDKPGPKKIVAAEKHASTIWPSSKKIRTQEAPQRTINSGKNMLRFKCSQCMDNIEHAPKDLLKHFEETHKGCPPVFSCHMCKFTTHEFSYLQVHVLSHKDTFSCCSLCKDNVQRTWAEFSAHLTLVHTQDGKYLCDICKIFSTSNDKEFLEHVLLHNLGLDRKNDQTISKRSYSCQYCGYEASQKVILTKHLKTAHGGVSCQKNKDVFTMNETKTKPRMTRSAVKDISWLTEDCLSLPGREFLDKYCHLSDAQTTLEETQQFLMKSGKQKWSKALKNVLSNVPQEMNLQSKLENGIASVFPDSSQDVLTVKNKINQNGASFAKRFKLITEKEVENANADSCGKIVSDASLSDCLQNQETKLSSDVTMAESTESPQMEENRENQRLKIDLNECNGEERIQDGGIANELKAEERKVVRKSLPKKKRKNMRWRNTKKKAKNADKLKTGLALKIVLRKNPKKGKQWVTQTALVPVKCNSKIDEFKTCTKPNVKNNVCKGDGTVKDKQEAGDCGTTNMAVKQKREIQDGGCSVEEEASVLVNGMKKMDHEKSEVCTDVVGSDGLKTRLDCFMKASPLLESVITPQSESSQSALPPPPTDTNLSESHITSCPDPSPSPSLSASWTPIPKNTERTLHLVAINPNQLVKRPVGEQPVVVLNHPDVDIPEVSKIMEVVNRYKGEVHKVVLSKQTINALSDINRASVNVQRDNTEQKNLVRERFLLKLKLRRLSKKKFEVVDDEMSQVHAGEEEKTFRCWFCGRAFGSRETWLIHRQRHLMEWKSPNCENS